jgi:hypothetical protein
MADPDDELVSFDDDDDGTGIADMLVEQDHAEEDDHDAGGLELDDSQQDEIRLIFLTSLPQYLEPVDQMVEQVFSGQDKNQDAKKTLNTTLASISEAAERLGINDVSASVERVREELLLLDDDNAAEVEKVVQQELANIKSIASGGGAAPPAAASGEKAQTLFVALKGAPGVDSAVLERLTSAGLVTVDQLKMARFDEIVAVTGLDAEQVKTVLAALGHEGPMPADRAAPPAARSTSDSELDRVEADLARTLNTQLEEEEQLAALRVEILRASELFEGLQQALVVAERNQERMHRSFSDSCDRLADRIEVLCKARARVEEQKRQKQAQEESLERLRDEVHALDSEERRAHNEHTKLSQRMDALVESVEQMLTPSRRT